MNDEPTDKSEQGNEAEKPAATPGVPPEAPETDKIHYRAILSGAPGSVSLSNYKDLAAALRERDLKRGGGGQSR